MDNFLNRNIYKLGKHSINTMVEINEVKQLWQEGFEESEIVEALYEDETNWNNGDMTSGQEVLTYDEVSVRVFDILNEYLVEWEIEKAESDAEDAEYDRLEDQRRGL